MIMMQPDLPLYNIITCFEPSGCIERKGKNMGRATKFAFFFPFFSFSQQPPLYVCQEGLTKEIKGIPLFFLSKELHFRCNEFF